MADPTRELVAGAIARRPAAVRELVHVLGPVVHGRVRKALARRRGGSTKGRDVAQEAEDLAQEVFVALFDDDAKALRAWDPERSPLGAFVALLTDHQVFSIFRSGKRRPWSDDLDVVAEPEAGEHGGDSPERRVSSREQLDALLDRMRAELTPKGFDLFARLYVQEQEVELVCQELGMKPDAVYAWRSRLAKLVRRFAAEMDGDAVSELAAPPRTSSVEGKSP